MRISIWIGDQMAHGVFADWDELVEYVNGYRKISGGASIVMQAAGCAQIEGKTPPAELKEERE